MAERDASDTSVLGVFASAPSSPKLVATTTETEAESNEPTAASASTTINQRFEFTTRPAKRKISFKRFLLCGRTPPAFTRAQWFLELCVGGALLSESLAAGAVIPVLGDISEGNLLLDDNQVALLVASYWITFMLLAPLLTYVSDRYRTRLVPMITALAILAAACFLFGSFSSSSFGMLVLATLMQGGAGGIIWAVAVASLADALPRDMLARSVPRALAMGSVGYVIGPLFGGAVFQFGTWAAPFFTLFGIALLAMFGWVVVDLEGAEEDYSGKVDPYDDDLVDDLAAKKPAALSRAAGVSTSLASISDKEETSPLFHDAAEEGEGTAVAPSKADSAIEIAPNPPPAPTLGSDIPLTIPPKTLEGILLDNSHTTNFIPRYRPDLELVVAFRPPKPKPAAQQDIGTNPKSLVMDPNLIVFLVLSVSSSMLLSGLDALIPVRFAKGFDAPPTAVSGVLLCIILASLLFAPLIDFIDKKYFNPMLRRFIACFGLLIAGVCGAMIGSAASVGWMVPGAIGLGLADGMWRSCGYGELARVLGDGKEGVGAFYAVWNLVRCIGSIAGPLAASAIVPLKGFYGGCGLLAGVAVLFAVVGAAAFGIIGYARWEPVKPGEQLDMGDEEKPPLAKTSARGAAEEMGEEMKEVQLNKTPIEGEGGAKPALPPRKNTEPIRGSLTRKGSSVSSVSRGSVF